MTHKKSAYYWLAVGALLLTLLVMLLGAYTRLSDAGLGCPDWPTCYGKMIVPHAKQALAQAQQSFPRQPLVAVKAWVEMSHRYAAGILGCLILVLALWGSLRRLKQHEQALFVPWILVATVALQATLGMWTVTWKLLPLVVTAHLLGGMLTAALLCWLVLCSRPPHLTGYQHKVADLKPWVIIGCLVLLGQIFLGAWTSTNYAALACPHFPWCQLHILPHLELAKAFNLSSPIGPNYEHGHLTMAVRVTIQMVHRYGALLTVAYLLVLGLRLWFVKRYVAFRKLAALLLLLLVLQVTLGILNVTWLLPMSTALAHNGVATLLLLTLVAMVYKTTHQPIARIV